MIFFINKSFAVPTLWKSAYFTNPVSPPPQGGNRTSLCLIFFILIQLQADLHHRLSELVPVYRRFFPVSPGRSRTTLV